MDEQKPNVDDYFNAYERFIFAFRNEELACNEFASFYYKPYKSLIKKIESVRVNSKRTKLDSVIRKNLLNKFNNDNALLFAEEGDTEIKIKHPLVRLDYFDTHKIERVPLRINSGVGNRQLHISEAYVTFKKEYQPLQDGMSFFVDPRAGTAYIHPSFPEVTIAPTEIKEAFARCGITSIKGPFILTQL